MSTRAVFEIRLVKRPATGRGRALAAWPDLRQESVAFSLARPRVVVGVHRVTGPEEGLAALLDADARALDPGVTRAIHYRAPGEVVFTTAGRVRAPTPAEARRVDAVAARILGQGRYFVERLEGRGLVGRWSLVTDHEAALPEFLRTVAANCRLDGREYRLVSLRPYAPGGDDVLLSARQEEAMLAAWRLGYYAGRAGVKDVASALGKSASGTHGLLQRAERILLGEAVKRIAARRGTPPPRATRSRRGPPTRRAPP